jgi:general secretion pathway protein G
MLPGGSAVAIDSHPVATAMRCSRRAGFTLIEVLIVVVIMAILAAVVLPQVSSSTKDAKEALLRDHLRTVRTQIELYKEQHLGVYPPNVNIQLLKATDIYGNVSDSGLADAQHPFGPYLKKIPEQPVTGISMCKVKSGTGPPALYPGEGMGWVYQPQTGLFCADSTDYGEW